MTTYADFIDELRDRLGSLMTIYTDSNLYAHLNFDGNTSNFLDPADSRAQFSGPTPTYVTGKYNTGGRFTSQATVSISTGDTATWSANAWVRFPATTSSTARNIFVMSNIVPDTSDIGFQISGSELISVNGATTSSIYTLSSDVTSSYTLLSVVKDGSNVTWYVGTTSSHTSSSALSNGGAIYFGAAADSIDFDKMMSWDKALSLDEITWINQGFRVYVDEETENTIVLPGIAIYTNPDLPAKYWLGTNEEVTHQYVIDLAFKYGGHTRSIDGASLSTYNLGWYYVDTVNKMLNAINFTTSNINETQRTVEVIRQIDRYDHGYLGGCSARLTFTRQLDWSA